MVIYSGYWPDWSISRDVIGRLSVKPWCYWLWRLLNLCLTSTYYFQYNGKHYKQLHGTAMGSPVSVVVAEIVMQNIEEQALATYTRTVPLWLRYVDDTFTAVHKDGIDDFHEHLNRQNADIHFTKEIEKNGKIPFVDCLVTRDNKRLRTNICRKSTHTDRLLDQSSYNPISHKATTILTQFSWRLWHTNFEYYKEKFDAIAFGALRTQPARIWSYLPSLTRLFKSWIAQSNR